MLTRLKVSGFKNLVDVDISFGPFTCVAGANGVGKSNLFDAIRFLSALANDTLINAALSVRDEGGKTADIRNLFHRIGNKYDEQMFFEAEMIIPSEGIDDLGQKATASITFLRYEIVLGYRLDETLPSLGSLELIQEKLEHINIGSASKKISFPHNATNWRKSIIKGRRTTPFISTEINNEESERLIKLSQDGNAGRPRRVLARNLPRTVLSTVNATESPTALLARREMQSWKLLQLEPSALRESDKFTTTPGLKADGSHLPATLYYLARMSRNGSDDKPDTWIYDQIASRLSDLIDDVYSVDIDSDERRELLTLAVKDRDGAIHPARSLSDGTLRFLALAVLEIDPKVTGLICLEEPENGIHPERIPTILELLQDMAMDVTCSIDEDNPLRQVIINTHSPLVVSLVPHDCLLVAERKEIVKNGKRFKSAHFGFLPKTWRAKVYPDKNPIAYGKLISYLSMTREEMRMLESNTPKKQTKRVIDQDEIQQMLLFGK